MKRIVSYALAGLIGFTAMASGDAAQAAACTFHKVTAPVLDASRDAQKPGDFVGVLENGEMACVTREQTINGRKWGFVQHKLAAGGKIVPVGGWVGLRFMALQSTAATPKAAIAAPVQPVVAAPPAAAPAPQPAAAAQPKETAASAYQAAVEMGSCDAYRAFEEHYRSSFHGRLAAKYLNSNCQNGDPQQAKAAQPAAAPGAAPAAPVATAPAAAPPVAGNPQVFRPQISQAQVAPSLQAALQAVGCYSGGIDGDWGRGSQNALARFNLMAGTQYPVANPSAETLAAVQGWQGGQCAALAAKPKATKKTVRRKATKKKTASRKKSAPSKAKKNEAAGRAVGTIIGVGAGIALGF